MWSWDACYRLMFRATSQLYFCAFLSNVLTTGSGRREEIWRAGTSQADAPSVVTLNAQDRPAASSPWSSHNSMGVNEVNLKKLLSYKRDVMSHKTLFMNTIIANNCITPNMYCNWGYKALCNTYGVNDGYLTLTPCLSNISIYRRCMLMHIYNISMIWMFVW